MVQKAADPTVPQQLQGFAKELLEKVDAFMARHPQATQRAQFKQLAQQLNVPAPGLFVAAASAFALILVMALSLDGVALLAGFLYPLLGTLKAINVGEQGVMKFFLKYWLLYNFLNVATLVLPPLAWLPFFPLIKLLLVLWAFNPKTQGASFLYLKLRPFILPPLGIEFTPEPAAAAAPTASRKKSLGASASTATAGGGGGAASAVVGDEAQPPTAPAASYTLRVELAARGLEKPPEPERLDTLCQLRVLPTGRKAALDEGQWYKTPTNTTEPAEEPDWRHDPQFITLPGMEDNVLEVLVINKMSWKDQPLGKVRLPLKGLKLPIDNAVPLEDPNGENNPVQGELEIHLSLVEQEE